MSQIREIKNRILSVKKTQQITSAMKMIASVKYRHSEKKMLQMRPYAAQMKTLLQSIALRNKGLIDKAFQPCDTSRPLKKLLVVILSDRGMCGSYNSNIIKTAYNDLNDNSETEILLIGRKAKLLFEKKGYTLFRFSLNDSKDYTHGFFENLSQQVLKAFFKRFDQVDLLYTGYRSAMERQVVLETLLPVLPLVQDSLAERQEVNTQNLLPDYIYELSEDELLSTLIEKHVTTQLRMAAWEAKTSEESARMAAMDSATSNAREMIKSLTLEYNRARQAGITKEIIEIATGAEALSA